MKCHSLLSIMLSPLTVAAAMLAGAAASAGESAAGPRSDIVVPQSSIERPEDLGARAHTYIRGRIIPGPATLTRMGLFSSATHQETPASLACIYHLVYQTSGCDPNAVATLAHGGSRTIAIVDAFDDPTAVGDLARFNGIYHLPTAPFTKVYATGHKPAFDSGWQTEESLDVQWAHALAPHARIILVEAASSSFTDLFFAVKKAAALVAAAGGGEVSNSWGGSEFSRETTFDSTFVMKGVVFLASTGDAPGTQYPSASPNVVAVGGTTIERDSLTDVLLYEATWDQAGGGRSPVEARPPYQSSIASIVGTRRGLPDLSADANPDSGVLIVVNGAPSPLLWGGTSLSAPLAAAIVNAAGKFKPSSASELTSIYGNKGFPTEYHDIIHGHCGPGGSLYAVKGWDRCTGVGTPNGLGGK